MLGDESTLAYLCLPLAQPLASAAANTTTLAQPPSLPLALLRSSSAQCSSLTSTWSQLHHEHFLNALVPGVGHCLSATGDGSLGPADCWIISSCQDHPQHRLLQIKGPWALRLRCVCSSELSYTLSDSSSAEGREIITMPGLSCNSSSSWFHEESSEAEIVEGWVLEFLQRLIIAYDLFQEGT